MTGKTASSAILKWFAGLSIREASRMPSFGFWIPQQNTIVHADSWLSGECRMQWLGVWLPGNSEDRYYSRQIGSHPGNIGAEEGEACMPASLPRGRSRQR